MGRLAIDGTEEPDSVDSELVTVNIVFPALW